VGSLYWRRRSLWRGERQQPRKTNTAGRVEPRPNASCPFYTDPYAAPGARQLAHEELMMLWSQATPASDENAHKLIQSFAQQPQTVVVPVVPAW
jgi:hypothetical protein